MPDRIICHVDLNSCFANVAVREKPWLKGHPLVVGGDEESRHGIVLAKTPEAKRFKIPTGAPLWQARQLCPGVLVEPINDALYEVISWASEDFFAKLYEYTDLVEPFGCDGAWMDVTGTAHLFGGVVKMVQEIQRRFIVEEGLTVSIGVSWNKVFSKLASERKKPNGITFITRSDEADTEWHKQVHPLPVDEMVYIGRSRRAALARIGAHTLGQLAALDEKTLVEMFGVEGYTIYDYAQGTESAPVVAGGAEPPMKSFSNGSTTPRDLTTWGEYWWLTCVLAERMGERMRAHRMIAKTIDVGITYVDTDREMRYQSLQGPLEVPTALSMELANGAFDLLKRKFRLRPIRKLTVRGKNLLFATDPRQLTFAMNAEKREGLEQLEESIDGINARWPLCVRRCVTTLDPELTYLGVKKAQDFAPPGVRAV